MRAGIRISYTGATGLIRSVDSVAGVGKGGGVGLTPTFHMLCTYALLEPPYLAFSSTPALSPGPWDTPQLRCVLAHVNIHITKVMALAFQTPEARFPAMQIKPWSGSDGKERVSSREGKVPMVGSKWSWVVSITFGVWLVLLVALGRPGDRGHKVLQKNEAKFKFRRKNGMAALR